MASAARRAGFRARITYGERGGICGALLRSQVNAALVAHSGLSGGAHRGSRGNCGYRHAAPDGGSRGRRAHRPARQRRCRDVRRGFVAIGEVAGGAKGSRARRRFGSPVARQTLQRRHRCSHRPSGIRFREGKRLAGRPSASSAGFQSRRRNIEVSGGCRPTSLASRAGSARSRPGDGHIDSRAGSRQSCGYIATAASHGSGQRGAYGFTHGVGI